VLQRLNHAQKDLQHGGEGTRIVPKEIAQPLWKQQHSLTHRRPRENLIDQVRRRLHHAPGIARRAERASFTGKSPMTL